MLYFFCTFSNFISKDVLRWSNITETLLIVRLEGSNRFGKHLFVCVSFFFSLTKTKTKQKKIGWADLNKCLLREIKVFKCLNIPNIVAPPPQKKKKKKKNWESFYHHFMISMGSFKYALFVCLFLSVPFHFFPNPDSVGEKERDKHKWHKVHKTVKEGKQKLNRSLRSLLTSSRIASTL